MAKIPKLYENPYETQEPEAVAGAQPNYARRRRIAGAVVGVAIAPLLVRAYIQSNSYGYHGHSPSVITQPR